MTEEAEIILQSYAKNSINNYEMEDYTIKYHEGNFICGDDIFVYLKIKDNIVVEYCFSGNTSMVSKASASFLNDIIVGKNIKEILDITIALYDKYNIKVSARRTNALHLPLLAVRNAIHEYLNDGEIEDFEDLEK